MNRLARPTPKPAAQPPSSPKHTPRPTGGSAPASGPRPLGYSGASSFSPQNLRRGPWIDGAPTMPPLRKKSDTGGVKAKGPLPQMNGKEAAKQLHPSNYIGGADDPQRAQDFMDLVLQHQGDPKFLADLYAALGIDDSKVLLTKASSIITYDNGATFQSEAEVQAMVTALTQSLKNMSEADLRELGKSAAEGLGGSPTPLTTLLRQPGAPLEAKRAFLDAAKEKALSDNGNAFLQAHEIGNVLASDKALFRSYVNAWGAALAAIVKVGMTVPARNLTTDRAWASMRPDGLTQLFQMAAGLPNKPSATDTYTVFRAQLFREVASLLKDTETGKNRHPTLVKSLETLFLSDKKGILERLFNNSSATDDTGYDDSQKALGLFLREALFARPDPNSALVKTVSDFMGELRKGALNPANKTKDPNNVRYALWLGDMVGSVAIGYAMAVKDNVNQQAANAALAKSLVGMLSHAIDVKGAPKEIGKEQAQELAEKIVADLMNRGLATQKELMTAVMKEMLDDAFAGFRDFDPTQGPLLEATAKLEVVWLNFMARLFE